MGKGEEGREDLKRGERVDRSGVERGRGREGNAFSSNKSARRFSWGKIESRSYRVKHDGKHR